MMVSEVVGQMVGHNPFIIWTAYYPYDDQRLVVLVFAE